MGVRAIAFAAMSAAGLVLLAGCGGGGGTPVDGKVVIGAKEYNPETDGDMTIGLVPEGGPGKDTYSGRVGAGGAFTIKGAQGGGVPAGRYKVSATRYPSKAEMKGSGPPQPKSQEYSETWDVSSSNHTFTLDAAKLK